jgi:hypothetical protein
MSMVPLLLLLLLLLMCPTHTLHIFTATHFVANCIT